ncbi:MAG: flagellar hook-length control protein FliK [Desulfamplus sp.]|nr:flagellar hook-length control protein FliK [Desulfamplus sp.]
MHQSIFMTQLAVAKMMPPSGRAQFAGTISSALENGRISGNGDFTSSSFQDQLKMLLSTPSVPTTDAPSISAKADHLKMFVSSINEFNARFSGTNLQQGSQSVASGGLFSGLGRGSVGGDSLRDLSLSFHEDSLSGELQGVSGFDFLSKFKQYLMGSIKNFDKVEMDGGELEKFASILARAGFDPSRVSSLIEELQGDSEEGTVSLSHLMDGLFALDPETSLISNFTLNSEFDLDSEFSLNFQTTSGQGADSSMAGLDAPFPLFDFSSSFDDTTSDKGTNSEPMLLDTSLLPFISSLLKGIGVPDDRSVSLLGASEVKNKGIDLDKLIQSLREIQKDGFLTGESFISRPGDQSAHILGRIEQALHQANKNGTLNGPGDALNFGSNKLDLKNRIGFKDDNGLNNDSRNNDSRDLNGRRTLGDLISMLENFRKEGTSSTASRIDQDTDSNSRTKDSQGIAVDEGLPSGALSVDAGGGDAGGRSNLEKVWANILSKVSDASGTGGVNAASDSPSGTGSHPGDLAGDLKLKTILDQLLSRGDDGTRDEGMRDKTIKDEDLNSGAFSGDAGSKSRLARILANILSNSPDDNHDNALESDVNIPASGSDQGLSGNSQILSGNTDELSVNSQVFSGVSGDVSGKLKLRAIFDELLSRAGVSVSSDGDVVDGVTGDEIFSQGISGNFQGLSGNTQGISGGTEELLMNSQVSSGGSGDAGSKSDLAGIFANLLSNATDDNQNSGTAIDEPDSPIKKAVPGFGASRDQAAPGVHLNVDTPGTAGPATGQDAADIKGMEARIAGTEIQPDPLHLTSQARGDNRVESRAGRLSPGMDAVIPGSDQKDASSGADSGQTGGSFSGGESRDSQVSMTREKPASAPLPSYVTNQVGKSIVRAFNRGESEIRLQLKPVELGRLFMTIDTHGDTMKVSIVTENQAARELLSAHANDLKAALASNGINIEKFTVEMGNDFSQSMANSKEQFNGSDSSGSRRGRGRSSGRNGVSQGEVEGVDPSGMPGNENGALHFVA